MVAEARANYDSDYAAITAVAQKLGIGTLTWTKAAPTTALHIRFAQNRTLVRAFTGVSKHTKGGSEIFRNRL